MGLIDQAINDIAEILSGDASVEITLISPDDLEVTIPGLHTRHHQGMDPNTGADISTKKASVTISEKILIAANPNFPFRVKDEVNLKDYRVRVKDSTGTLRKYKAEQWLPDETIGLTVILLSICAD